MKIGFALLSDTRAPAPSTRIACLNLFPALSAMGYEPVVIFEQAKASTEPNMSGVAERAAAFGCDVVVFQKIRGASVIECVNRLRQLNIATVYCCCDLVDNSMATAVDRTALVTEFLRSQYARDLHSKIDVVHDGIERPDLHKQMAPQRSDRHLRAALVTSVDLYSLPVIGTPPAPWHVNVMGRFPYDRAQRRRSLRWAVMGSRNFATAFAMLRGALHPRMTHTPWSLDGVYEGLMHADIGIIPVDATNSDINLEAPLPAWKLKSENRLTLKMAMGLPVIATPIPSYESVIEHGVNGFFALTAQDWKRYFNELRDPDLRAAVGARARASVLNRFSIDSQARKFADCLQRSCAVHGVREQKVVRADCM